MKSHPYFRWFFGTISRREAEEHLMATINIRPTNAAMGNCSIKLDPNIINTNSIMAAVIPDNRALAPAEVFIKL